MGEQITAAKKRKTKRRSRAQVEADRRLAALRKNLAVEIEADISRFSGEGQSPVAGFLVLTRVRILLAFFRPSSLCSSKHQSHGVFPRKRPRGVERGEGGLSLAKRRMPELRAQPRLKCPCKLLMSQNHKDLLQISLPTPKRSEPTGLV